MDEQARTPWRGRSAVTLSEADVAALVTRQLSSRTDLPIRDIVVRLSESGAADIVGRMTVQDIVQRRPAVKRIVSVLPSSWQSHPVWVAVRAVPHLGRDESRRHVYLTLEVSRLAVGRQALPAAVAGWVGVGLLRWELPDEIEEVSLERGQVTVRIASSQPRSEAAGRR